MQSTLAHADEPAGAKEPAGKEPTGKEPGKEPAGKEPSPAERERSRAAFRKGVGQLKAQDYAGARASFEEAWSLVQHPSILLNLGIARLKTDDPILAESDLSRFMNEDSSATAEELASARDALAEARSKIGTIKVVAVPKTSKVSVDGKAIAGKVPDGGEAVNADVRVNAGKHTLTVEADGYATDQREVEVAGKADAEVSIALVKGSGEAAPAAAASDPGTRKGAWMTPGTRKIVTYSLLGAGGLSLVGMSIFGLRGISLANDHNDPSSPSFGNAQVAADAKNSLTAADVFLVVGVVCLAGGAVLLFTDIGKGTAAAKPAMRWHPTQPLLYRW